MKKIFLIFSMILLITGCAISEETKVKYEKQAEKNAINYLSEKYGIKAEILSSNAEITVDGEFGNMLSGFVFLELKYNNKKFDVYIPGDVESIKGVDNYQSEEITNAILQKISADIKYDMREYNISYGLDNNLINEYYDGINLNEILSDHTLLVDLHLIGHNNLQEITFNNSNNLINTQRRYITIFNHKSLESYQNYKSAKIEENDSYKSYGMYVEDVLHLTNGERKYYNFDMIEYDGIYFYLDNNNTPSLSSTLIDDISNWNNSAVKVTGAYLLNTELINNDKLYIYIPVDKFQAEKENLKVAIQCTKNNKSLYHTTSNVNKYGDYYIGYLYSSFCDNGNNIKFTILQENQ